MEWIVDDKTRIQLPGALVSSVWQEAAVNGEKFQICYEPDLDTLFVRSAKGGSERTLPLAYFSSQRGYEQGFDFRLSFYKQEKIFSDGSIKVYSPFAGIQAAGEKNKVRTIASPITGAVLKVAKKAGDSVEKGDTVLVIEAMKMENQIQAPFAGVVTELHVVPQGAVVTGAPLFTLKEGL